MITPETTSSDDAIRFPSLDSFRAAHTELLKAFRTNGSTAEMVARVELFIQRGKATGALLDADADRWTAQSELDYWATQLYQPDYEPPDATLDEFDPQLAPELDDSLCPYRGLDAFLEGNESVFFGRERLVNELIDKLKTTRFLPVLGSSGSGKSSLVRAGLIPQLKKGALPGSTNWLYFKPMVPGANPLLNLARLMAPPEGTAAQIEFETDALREDSEYLVQMVTEGTDKNVVLVVDQFEEIFTLCTDDIARQRFVENLLALCQVPEAEHRVIITMRTDFEMNITRLSQLQVIFEQDVVRVTPLTASELRQSIEAPAALLGLKFEQGVVDALLNDILGEPSALPLLQFTLLKLWENRDRNRVTWESYRKLGGGRQALARSADEFYNRLIPEEQLTMRRILLKMVRPGEGLEVTSNRIERKVLYIKAEASDRIDRVLDKLIKERLVRVSEGNSVAHERIEIAHEALVRNWPRLVEWLEEERLALRQRLRLTTAAEEWQRLNGATAALWRRELLEEALRYDDLNELERKFVKASKARQQRARRFWVYGIVTIITFLSAATIINIRLADTALENLEKAQAASTLAFENQKIAEDNAEIATINEAKAIEQANIALASRLASQAQLIIETQKSKQSVGVLLAIQSMRMSTSVEASRILQNNSLPIIAARMDFGDGINSIAFSPDGQYLVSGSADGTARVLKVSTGTEIARMTHDDRINSVAFSPDGEYVVSGSDDYTARVWEAVTGTEIASMAHNEWVNSVIFSPDGQYVASGSADGTARVWEAATGTEIARMTHDDRINSIAFSPDGQYVVSGSDDYTARVWQVATGTEIASVVHNDWVNSVAFSPDGQYVVSGSADVTARVWEAATGTEIARMTHDDWVNSVAFSPDGKYVVSGSYDYTARVWEAATGTEIARISHDSPIWAVSFSQDGQQIISGSDDGTALISDAFTGEPIASMNHDGEVRAIAFSPDGQYAASGVCHVLGKNEENIGDFCYQGYVHVWRGATSSGNTLATHDDWVNSVAFSPDGKYVVSGSGDGTARVWEAATGTEIASVAHDDWVNSVAFSPDGKYVVSGSDDGTARVWEVLSENEIFRITFERGSVWFVAFSPNGQHIALGGCGELEDIEDLVCARGKISIVEINTEKEIFQRTYDDWVNSVAFSTDSQYIVLGGDDSTARVLEIPSGTEIARVTHGDWVNSVDFGPDNQYVVSGSSDGTARVWEAATGKEIARIIHDESVKSVAFSPDGQYVASGSDDGTTRLWEAGTGKEIARMSHGDWVRSVAFSLDGHYVVTGSADGSIRLASWNPLDLIASTCSRLSRNLTNAEWKQYLGDEPYQATCTNLPIHPTVIAETILPTLLNANDDNRNQMAVEIASEMLKVNSTGENSNEQAIKLVNSTILDRIYVSAPDLEAGKIEPLLILLEDAKMNRLEINDANILNSTCWFGSIYGYAEDVLQYCEQAVALFNDDEAFRDSRGLARALTGDYAGAIEDFQFFIDYGEFYDKAWVQQRQEWIVALGEGKNPFTPEVLESIKNQ